MKDFGSNIHFHALLPNQVVEDCFVRTQDDGAYVGGRGMKRIVFWQDSNGCVFVLNHIGTEGINAHPLVIEDITVVYARTKFPHVGGNIFDLRGVGEGREDIPSHSGKFMYNLNRMKLSPHI